MGPDFHSYSYQQLIQSFRNVNRKKYPEHFEEILSELRKKKPDHIEIIRVESGYRIIRKEQIPKKLGSKHKSKTFSFDTSSKEYYSTFLRTSLIIVTLSLAAVVRYWTSDYGYKVEFTIAFFGILALGSLFTFLKKCFKGSRVEFVFNDDHIIEMRGKEKKIYYLTELRNIYSNDSENYDNPVDMIELTFEIKRKLRFSSFEPQFNQIRQYLRQYLSERMKYEYYLDGDSVI